VARGGDQEHGPGPRAGRVKIGDVEREPEPERGAHTPMQTETQLQIGRLDGRHARSPARPAPGTRDQRPRLARRCPHEPSNGERHCSAPATALAAARPERNAPSTREPPKASPARTSRPPRAVQHRFGYATLGVASRQRCSTTSRTSASCSHGRASTRGRGIRRLASCCRCIVIDLGQTYRHLGRPWTEDEISVRYATRTAAAGSCSVRRRTPPRSGRSRSS
jgi:hypothetical protein